MTLSELSEEVEVVLRERLEELEVLEASGAAPPDTIERLVSVRFLLELRGSYRPAVPKQYGKKARPVLADFDRKADKWGSA